MRFALCQSAWLGTWAHLGAALRLTAVLSAEQTFVALVPDDRFADKVDVGSDCC